MRKLMLKYKVVVIGVCLFQVISLSDLTNFSLTFFNSLYATEAMTAKKLRIAIIDIGGKTSDENIRKNILKTVRTGFQNQTDIKPLSDTKIMNYVMKRQNIDRGSGRENLRKAFKLLRDGKKAYNKMNMPEAIERLSKAKKEFVTALNELKSNEKLLEAYLYLGMAYAAIGKRKRAYSEFKKALYLDGKIHLSPKEYSPAVIKVFERAKRDMADLPKGTLLVDSVPSDSTVYVNAKDIGVTPLNTLYHVGQYFMKIEKEGYLEWYQLISVEDKINTVEVELAPIAADDELVVSLKPVSEPSYVDQYTAALLIDIKKKLGVDLIFLGWIERSVRDMIAGQFYDTRTGKFSAVVQSSMGKNFSNIDYGVRRMINELNTSIDKSGYVIAMQEVKDEPLPLVPPTKPPTPQEIRAQKSKLWYNKWWVWALIGGFAAGAGVGIYYGVQGGSSNGITVINEGNF